MSIRAMLLAYGLITPRPDAPIDAPMVRPCRVLDLDDVGRRVAARDLGQRVGDARAHFDNSAFTRLGPVLGRPS